MPDSTSDQVTLRAAVFEDCRRVWEWRNEQATREASFNKEFIPFEEHERWFARKFADPNMRIFIAEDGQGDEVGYVRFDISKGEAEISVSIDKNERGKGYGIEIIKKGSDQLLTTEPVKRIVAYIKLGNPASKVAFERAGFVLQGYRQVEGVESYEMVYEGKLTDR
ncbi:MAG: GNAT family N-acetyltransferase [Ignavibacteria bacterium]|nr:GNAT family N-acetyltransferase [Ignavibacteria bacterium]